MTNHNTDNGSAQTRIALEQARLFVRNRIEQTLNRSTAAVRDVMDHLTQSSGKYFRAYLLLAAAADENDQVPVAAVDAAAALEILHLATLVHDDIIDDAPLRRGQPSVQSRFGKKTAVLSGDYLFSLALTLLAGIAEQYPVKYSEFSRAIAQICLGELSQHQHNHDPNITVFSYLRIIAGKTAILFSLAMYAGAILNGDTEDKARRLGRFGHYLGMHFQLADDCLDYEASTETMKKQTSKDLAEGVVTLPLILALAQNPTLRSIVSRLDLSTQEIAQITSDVVNQGHVRSARAFATRYQQRAENLLSQISGATRRQRLSGILAAIITRSY
ncbi:MAG: polyprenyl synthetase family protein [Eubacteriales bacterium]|nr:polyprenyl synthetase family protein [Eubacteriales bacterium]